MPNWKKLAYLTILLAFFTTSCWNLRELNELAIVVGMGLDAGPEEGTVSVTSQVIKPAKMKTGAEKSSEPKPYLNITDTGKTVFEAIRKESRSIDRRLYFPHSQVIIISEELAKKGVSKYLDLLIRDPEIRRDNFVLISKNKTSEILEAQTDLEDVPGISIYHLVKRRTAASLATGFTLQQFAERLMSKTAAPIASRLELNKEDNKLTLSGTAVFKKDKLAGYLNEKETRGLLWTLGEVKAGVIVVKCPDGDGNVTLEIMSSKGTINPKMTGEQMELEIKIGIMVHLAEQGCPGDLTTPENSTFLKKELEEAIKNEITAALSKARELNCDIFALGEKINKKYKGQWKEMEQDWDVLFKQQQVTITVEPVLTRSGMISKPARPEE